MKARTGILCTAAALAAVGGGATGAGAHDTVACAAPAKPTLIALSTTSATLASAVDPGGTALRGSFRIGRTSTYAVLLGRGGYGSVAWQATVSRLSPGHRYTVTARAFGAACSSERSKTFTTPRQQSRPVAAVAAPAPAAPAAPAAAADETGADQAEPSWAW
jgi:hypothetical protein